MREEVLLLGGWVELVAIGATFVHVRSAKGQEFVIAKSSVYGWRLA